MKYSIYIFLLFSILLFVSCDDNSVPFGKVEYYPSFLWSNSNITPVKKTFEFEFSQDAQDDSESYAEFQFVDNDGKPISTNVMQVSDGGETLPNNKIRVNSNVKSKELTFTFSPSAANRKYQGYLKLVNHNLDRIESQQLQPGDEYDVLQWTLYYDKLMNPLAKTLMWIGIIILTLLIIWHGLLKSVFYPRFGSIQKIFNVPGMAPLIVNFKKARLVVVAASHQKKQSRWNRFWTGEIIYKTHPAFSSPIIFKPCGGRQVLAIVQLGTYQVLPNPMPGIGTATIIDIKKNLKINVN